MIVQSVWITMNCCGATTFTMNTLELKGTKYSSCKSSVPKRGEISRLDRKNGSKEASGVFVVSVPSSNDFSSLWAPMVADSLYSESEETMKTLKLRVDALKSTWNNQKSFVIVSFRCHILGNLSRVEQLKSWEPWGACSYIDILQHRT